MLINKIFFILPFFLILENHYIQQDSCKRGLTNIPCSDSLKYSNPISNSNKTEVYISIEDSLTEIPLFHNKDIKIDLINELYSFSEKINLRVNSFFQKIGFTIKINSDKIIIIPSLVVFLIIVLKKFFFGKKTRRKISYGEKENHKLNKINFSKSKIETKRDFLKINTLEKDEIILLNGNFENRWLTISHSSTGKNHKSSNPPIPCQDNSHYQDLNKTWKLAVICDGAGSSKLSHISSKIVSENIVPDILSNELVKFNWFNKGKFPSKNQWENTGLDLMKKMFNELQLKINHKGNNPNNLSIDEFATTVIISIYNRKGILSLSVGDGRSGYLNDRGELNSITTPFKGRESNETVFITSPIWDNPKKYIQTKCIQENIISVFMLSDGMEKVSYECSKIIEGNFIDPNIPYKNFFLPIFLRLKKTNKKDESKLNKEWIEFLESGNNDIVEEGDDKTLLISLYK